METWEVSLQFYIGLFERGYRKSIVRLTNTNTDEGNVGDRIMAVFVDTSNKKLQIHCDVESEPLYQFTHPDLLMINYWYDLKIQKSFEKGEFLLRTTLNGTIINEKFLKYWQRPYDNVTIYAADGYFPPALKAWVDQLNITSG